MAKCPELIVVGGGLAGLLLAAHAGERFGDLLNITVIERTLPKAPEASLDTRATALSRGSKELLESWGFWAEVSASAKAIENIHVSRKSRFGSALLQDDAIENEPMGWVVENALLQAALLARCDAVAVNVVEGHEVVNFTTTSDRPVLTLDDERQLVADLVIISDGAESSLRNQLGIGAKRHAPSQFAIAFNCETDGVDTGIAYERFTNEGPLAFLPLPGSDDNKLRYNVIWCAHQATQSRLLALDDQDFIGELQAMVGWRAGRVTKIGRRVGWPLSVVVSRELVRSRCLLLGNSAHTVHPVAGQGFNLSVRDVDRLIALLDAELQAQSPFDSVARLSDFERASLLDHEQTIAATILLSGLFDMPQPLMDSMSSVALSATDLVAPIRRGVANFGMGRR
jgi:ubiquinone biosynthesis UbiH/UbiF/VisC/COQ6 family hydroxylase